MMLHVLIVDDDYELRELMAEHLRGEGFEVVCAGSTTSALAVMKTRGFDVVLCDVRLPDGDGATLARRVRVEHPETDVLVMTSFGDVRDAVRAFHSGVLDYLTKPVDIDLLVQDILRPMATSAPARRLRRKHAGERWG